MRSISDVSFCSCHYLLIGQPTFRQNSRVLYIRHLRTDTEKTSSSRIMVSNKEEQLTGSTCYLAQNSFLFTSNVTAVVVKSAYIHIHIQDVSDKGGHILDTWSVYRNKGKASKMGLRRRSFFVMITSGINPHENNISDNSISSRTMAGLLLPLSNSYSTHANLPHHVVQVSALYCYT
jgi:hypothetical protein